MYTPLDIVILQKLHHTNYFELLVYFYLFKISIFVFLLVIDNVIDKDIIISISIHHSLKR